jgi:hypothetical protein
METIERAVHLVGTYPIPMGGDEAAMHDMLEIASPYLRSLPSGETDRLGWITDEDLKYLQDHPDIRVLEPNEDPDPSDYLGNRWKMAVKPGHTFRAELIDMRYYQRIRANWPAFSALRDKYERPDLAYQVNLPGTLQTPMFAFRRKSAVKSLVNAFRYRQPMAEALQKEVNNIHTSPEIGDPGVDKNQDLVYQIEIPAEEGGMNQLPPRLQPVTNPILGSVLARGVVRQIAGLPEGSRSIIHTCKGDWEHRAFSDSSTDLIVALSSAIIRQWPPGRDLAGIHIPFGAGRTPPSLEASHYAPLGTLAAQLPKNTRLIAGLVHEKLSLGQQRDILHRIEDIMQRSVDISASCGFGRVSLGVARRLTRKAVALVASE